MRSCLILKVLQQPDSVTGITLADWDLLVRQARQSNLLSRLYVMLNERGLMAQVPAQPRRHLEWAAAVADRHTIAVHREIALIGKALAPLRIPVILLKGAAYVLAGLPAAQGRLFTDIDILVPEASLNAVEAALLLHGWATTHHDAYDQHYYRAWMHELPPMQHIKRLTVLDVHHAILPRTAAIHPDSEKLRAAAVRLNDTLSVLSPVDMVLHSATHLFHAGEMEHGLRDLADIDSLLRHYGKTPSFWTELPERARELELTRPLYYALRYASKLLHSPVPDSVVTERPHRLLLAIMDTLFVRVLIPQTDWQSNTARRLLYVRANWQRMPPWRLARHLFHKAFLSPKQT